MQNSPLAESKIRVLVVDDSDVHVRAVLALLAEHPDLDVVGRARTGGDGMSWAGAARRRWP